MCPACFASTTIVLASIASGGGVAAFLARIFFRNRNQQKTEEQNR